MSRKKKRIKITICGTNKEKIFRKGPIALNISDNQEQIEDNGRLQKSQSESFTRPHRSTTKI